ncbi:ribonuclease H-like domain-containing protein [Tanacetum coccineum]
MAGSEDDIPPPPPPSQTPTQQTPHTVSTIKLPILKKGEYDIWAMKMEHYLAHTDYPIWEVIQRGNGPVSVSTDTNGLIKVLPSKTAEETLAKERERKARTTLLMALPEDHLAKFYKMTDAKEMWETIKSRFGGNDESKKMQNHNSQYEHPSSYSLLANQSSCPQLDHEDLEQLDEFDLEEMDLKWQVAMISIRMKKFYKKTGRKLQFDAKELVGFDKTKVECYSCHKIWNFAREYRSKGNQDSRRRDAWNTRNKDKENRRRSGKQEDSKALVTLDGEGVDWTSHSEDEQENYALMACSSSGSDTEVTSCSKECKESYAKLKKLYDEQREKIGDASIEIHAYTQALKKVKAQLVAHQQSQLWYEEKIRFMKIDLDDKTDVLTYHKKLLAEAEKEKEELKTKGSGQREIRPVWNNVQRVNHQNQFVPKALLTRTGNSKLILQDNVPTNAARKVNTVKPIVNNARPKAGFHKTLSPFRKPFNRTTTLRTNFSYQKVNTAEVNAVSAVGGKRETAVKPSTGDYPQRALQNKGIVDSGCSRHMTGNKAYLAEYQDFNGGPVAFGGSKGYITGKGKIKIGKLDFEDVCFVKELQHFNLFFVSQMCDKKNKVLFTDTECLVLSPEFKLPDENQVLLRIPRQNNMYSFNLENIVPSRGLACLIAKATIDESNKWHRRLGHVNFKNLNKLVKGNLVRGLPSKIFQNDHTCVACQKGKQHKASCKRPISALYRVSHDSFCMWISLDLHFQELKSKECSLKRQTRMQRCTEALKKEFAKETKDLLLQAGAAKASSTNTVNTASTPISTASPYGGLSFTDTNQDDSEIHALEDM